MNRRVEGNLIYFSVGDPMNKTARTEETGIPVELLGDQDTDCGGATGEPFSSEEVEAWMNAVQGTKLDTESPKVVWLDGFRSKKRPSINQHTGENT